MENPSEHKLNLGAAQTGNTDLTKLRKLEPKDWLNIPPPIVEACQVFREELLRLYQLNGKA